MNNFVEGGYYTIFKPTALTAPIPSTQSTLISDKAPFIVLNTEKRPAQIYCQYTGSTGGFVIYTMLDGVITNLGEKVNQWVNVTGDYVIVEGNIRINMQFKWV